MSKYISILFLSLLISIGIGCAVDGSQNDEVTIDKTEENVVGIVRHYYLHGNEPATFIDKEVKVGVSAQNDGDLAKVSQAIYTSDCVYSNGISLYYYTNYAPTLGYYICVHGVGTLDLTLTRYPQYLITCGTGSGGWVTYCRDSFSVAGHLRSLVNYNAESGSHKCTFYTAFGTTNVFYNYWDYLHRL